MRQQDFEFSEEQNATIRTLGSRMRFVGVIYIVLAALSGLLGILILALDPTAGIIYLILSVAIILIGIWTARAARSFRMIAETAGNDIGHLNSALESLRKLYELQFWVLAITIGTNILVFLIGFILGRS